MIIFRIVRPFEAENMQNQRIRVGKRRWYFVQETEVTEVGILLDFPAKIA